MVYGNAGDISKKGVRLVACKTATRPKEEGGLRIINFKHQNQALLKFLHKFLNRHDTPWVNLTWQFYYNNGKAPQTRRPVGSFWWKDVFSLNDKFRATARGKVGDGRSTAFWEDMWDIGVHV